MRFLVKLGLLYACVTTLLYHAIFFTAYLTPNRSVLLTFDSAGEADLEFVVLFLTMTPIVLYATMQALKVPVAEPQDAENEPHHEPIDTL